MFIQRILYNKLPNNYSNNFLKILRKGRYRGKKKKKNEKERERQRAEGEGGQD